MTSSFPGWIAASALAATTTLARCASAVIGSPLRKSALPPRATTIRMTSVSERRHQYGLDRMHTILGLFESNVEIGLEDVFGHLHRGQPELLMDVHSNLCFEIVECR